MKAPDTELKNWAFGLTTGRLTAAECEARLADLKRNRELVPRDAAFWDGEIRQLEEWMDSAAFRNGEYSPGLDTYMLAMVELRALFFAIQTAPTVHAIFQRRFLFQCLSGLAHEVIAHFFKLTEMKPGAKSLRNIWLKAWPEIEKSGISNRAEVDELSEWFNSRLNNRNSRLYRFRNKVMIHNEQLFEVTWDDFDKELRPLARVWSLITQWCSHGVLNPWHPVSEAFDGLELLVDRFDLNELRARRQEFLELFTDWCKRNLVSGELEKRGPFAEIRFGLADVKAGAR